MEDTLKADEVPAIRDAINAAVGDGKAFLTTSEAAAILRVSYFTIYREIRLSQLDATRVRKTWRIPVGSLIDYVERRSVLNRTDL